MIETYRKALVTAGLEAQLSALEAKSGVNQPPRIRVWLDEIEAKIDRVMERPDSTDFWIGM
jgi:hypothetical protein